MQRFLIYHGRVNVYLNTSTLLFAGYMVLTGHQDVLLASYLSICLHEGAHALTTCMLGHRPSEIEITPLGALMRMPSENIKFWAKILILLSGPGCTALLCASAAYFAMEQYAAFSFCRTVFHCNCTILLLNLLPCCPLDGGGVLSLVLSYVLPRSTVNVIMRSVGKAIGTLIIFCSIYLACNGGGFNLSLVFAGCLLIYAAYTSTTPEILHMMRMYMDRKTSLELKGIMRCKYYVSLETTPLLHVMRLFPAGWWANVIILESGTMHEKGTLTEADIVTHVMNHPMSTCAEALIYKETEK